VKDTALVVSAVVNHSKDAMSKVKPAVAEYVQTHQTANHSKDARLAKQRFLDTKFFKPAISF
jgi:hypothetical protein